MAIVELKGASYSISGVCSQFEGGLLLATNILKQSGCDRYKIFPVFVSKNFRDGGKARALKQKGVVFNGKKHEILFAKCGKRFSDIVLPKHK
ncbi:MAG: hypothetical protein OXU37_02420 [Thaumarchaeota archaeon]|nr:hypothetical protein [Nitrososphaerota archaeon]MDD9813117.1 hypothetical protein [Nitrososphaerota archaeon]